MVRADRIWSRAADDAVVLDGHGLEPGDGPVAVVATWAPDDRVNRSVVELVRELDRHGYQVVLSRAGSTAGALRWAGEIPERTVVLRRPNLGYDFGSWAAALRRYPELLDRERVLFANDSLVGPFGDLGPLLTDFEQRDCDFWGAVVNLQFFPHIQSFFFGFRNHVAGHPTVRGFWRSIRHYVDKQQFIHRYELGLSRTLYLEGLVAGAAHGAATTGYGTVNPTLNHWRQLLDRNFPFVKRALLDQGAGRRAEVAQAVRTRFGTEIEEWI